MSVLFQIIAAFGGGVFAASIGALPAFIMTGVFAVAGAVSGMAGSDAAGFLTGTMAFGPFFGPWVSFAGGVGAAAYAKKKGLNENGADIATACAKYGKADVLLMGGIFGVLGILLKLFVYDAIFNNGGSIYTIIANPKLVSDGGMVVFVSGIIARLAFGGKLKTSDKFISSGDALNTTITIGACYSLLVSAIYCLAAPAAEEAGWLDRLNGNFAVLIFGTAAVGLVFAEMGVAFTGCHHIVIIAAEAAVASYGVAGPIGALIVGTIFGTCAAILGDIEGNTINCGTDSHIDNPAFAIFILALVINLIFA